jgi:serine/threonine protein kinase
MFAQNTNKFQNGTIRYMAPEALQGALLVTPAADIFSFGITMWQLQEKRHPYNDIESNETVAYNVVKKRLRPDSIVLRRTVSEPAATKVVESEQPSTFKTEVSFRQLKAFQDVTNLCNTETLLRKRKRHLVDQYCCTNDSVWDPQSPFLEQLMKSEIFSLHNLDIESEQEAVNKLAYEHLFDENGNFSDKTDVLVAYKNLYRECWQQDPANRPAAEGVSRAICEMMSRCF